MSKRSTLARALEHLDEARRAIEPLGHRDHKASALDSGTVAKAKRHLGEAVNHIESVVKALPDE